MRRLALLGHLKASWNVCTSLRQGMQTNSTKGILNDSDDGDDLALPPAEAAAGAAVAPRRYFTKACADLAASCVKELDSEVRRDATDGMTALPPMVPEGWLMHHSPGSNYFTLVSNRRSPPAASKTGAAPIPSSRRFRSKQEEAAEDLVMEKRLSPNRAPVVYPKHEEAGRGAVRQRSSFASPFPTAPTSIEIFCPMRTRDPSHHDYDVDLCEWTCFDVVVRKDASRTANVLFLSLASVNSEVRVRRVQILSPAMVSSLLVPLGSSMESTLASFGCSGDYYRTAQVYCGPLMTDLPKSFREELLVYVDRTLGITPTLREYICQALFCVEQEEYMLWLAQLHQFSAKKRDGDRHGG